MVDFVRLQQLVQERLVEDRTIHAVETEGPTLEAAIAEAALLLNTSVRRMEYEVTYRGSAGFLGAWKKNWKIRAYESIRAKKDVASWESGEENIEPEQIVAKNRDGEVFVHLDRVGVFLKVTAPVGKGRRATEVQAAKALSIRRIKDFDQEVLLVALKEAKGEYVQVGNFDHDPMNDATMSLNITDQEMRAYLRVNPPGVGGCDLPAETYLSFLRDNQVLFGVKEDIVQELVDRPIYREDILIAEGSMPRNGRDAYLRYNFELDQSKVHLREGPDGRIDFRELNIIQNVVEGQPLARKIRAEAGVSGRTINGRLLPATDGKDTSLPLGKNVRIGDDGDTIIATTNGQVLIAGDNINVEPVYTVQGNVSLKTGNIIFLGTVIINGNVEDGFSVKAAGNIEVNGTVEKAELDAEGDIIVHQGIAGKGIGVIKAGRSIWARFIENTLVEAGNMVVVSDGIINSQVDAQKRIICQGKRAAIVGGRLRATEEINAKILGNPTSGTETICEVGFNPQSKKQLDKLVGERASVVKELEELQRMIQTLINIKKQRKSLPEEKEAEMRDMMNRQQDLSIELENIDGETLRIQEFLNKLNVRGRVSASSKVYPGVRIVIRDAKEDVRTEYRAITFILENELIRVTKYEEPEEDGEAGRDGYSTH